MHPFFSVPLGAIQKLAIPAKPASEVPEPGGNAACLSFILTGVGEFLTVPAEEPAAFVENSDPAIAVDGRAEKPDALAAIGRFGRRNWDRVGDQLVRGNVALDDILKPDFGILCFHPDLIVDAPYGVRPAQGPG